MNHIQISQSAQLNSQRGKIELNKMNEASSPLFMLCPPKMNNVEYLNVLRGKYKLYRHFKIQCFTKRYNCSRGKGNETIHEYHTENDNSSCKTTKAYILLLHAYSSLLKMKLPLFWKE